MKKFLFTVWIIFCSICSAQIKQTDPFFTDYVWRSWSSDDGLPGNAITDIIQNDDGYIFIGTYGGLVRFDGVEFITFNKFTDEKYNFLSARAVVEDSRGNLWIGSNDEGIVCALKDGTMKTFSVDNGLPNNSIRDMCEDRDGNMWIGTASGIACISKEFNVFSFNTTYAIILLTILSSFLVHITTVFSIQSKLFNAFSISHNSIRYPLNLTCLSFLPM